MKIATIGRGNIGGALAKRWRATGHEVTEFGSEGGNATGSDAVLVAIPSNAIENAFTKVAGINDAVVIDATNAFTGRDEEFESLAHQVKSHVNGPVAKAFNCNYAALYD
jgi:predicted dinucleotide-binding enzyme